ncbi:MAG: TetR/AcrR family transcriptional regulator [Myxococcaceae bacterium]|nr:TetR/AcrR family transcriptional regulator [Myxococcaceae bacterium]
MPRPPNTDQRRAQIVDGLLKVMSTKGYEGATTQDIAKAAKLSPGLVHYHFQAKAEVLEALMNRLLDEHLAALDAALTAAGADPLDRLDAFIDYHLATGASANPRALAVWVSLGAEALKSVDVRTRYVAGLEALLERLVVILQAGIEAGRFVDQPPRVAAAAILSTIEGYFVVAATARALIPRRSAAPALKAMARGLLEVAPEPRRRAPLRARRGSAS